MSRSPYIDNCNYPSGFTMLQHIYQDIQYVDNSQMIAANVSQTSPTREGLHGCVLFCSYWSLIRRSFLGETPGHFLWIPLDMSMSQQTVRKELVINQNNDIIVNFFSLMDSLQITYCSPWL